MLICAKNYTNPLTHLNATSENATSSTALFPGLRKKKGSQIAWNFVQVRFHFLQFVTTSRLLFPAIQTIFSFANCDKLFLFFASQIKSGMLNR